MSQIHAVVVPKWGLSMEEGTLLEWHIEEGDAVQVGDELVDIETSKVTNALESANTGILRRKVAVLDETYPCGTLLGVIADIEVSDPEIDAFISGYEVIAVESEQAGLAPQTALINGKSLRYLKQGEQGDAILFIHGFSGDLNNWMVLQPQLAGTHITYAIDLPGHGGSDKNMSGLHSLADVADLLLAFLERENITGAHLIAHSMGAPIAIHMADKNPDSVSRLTLLAPAGIGNPANPDFIHGIINAQSRRELTPVLKMLFADESLVSRDMADDMLKYKRIDGVQDALTVFAGFLAKENGLSLLERLDKPVKIVYGSDDRIVMPIDSEDLPNKVDVILLHNVGHMPHLEGSSEWAKHI